MQNNQTLTTILITGKVKLTISKDIPQRIEEMKIEEKTDERDTAIVPFNPNPVKSNLPIHNLKFTKDIRGWKVEGFKNELFGKRAFYKLWQGDDDTKEVSLEQFVRRNPTKVLSDMFVVQFENDRIRVHLAFDSVIEFYCYLFTIDSECWHFHELIPGKQWQKIRFDIDIKKEEFSQEEIKDFNLEFADNLRDAVIGKCVALIGDEKLTIEKDVVILSSHSATKFSYHIIINRLVKSNKHMAHIYQQVMNSLNLPPKHARFVDNCYKSNSFFRIAFNSKKCESRYLEFQENWVFQGRPIVHQYLFEDKTKSYQKYVQQLLESLCSYVGSATIETPLYEFKLPDEKKVNYANADVNEDDFQLAFNLLPESTQVQFRLGDIKGNLISLNRVHQGFCDICKRAHDNMGSYMIIDTMGNVYLYCLRDNAEVKTKLLVCKINLPQKGNINNTTVALIPNPVAQLPLNLGGIETFPLVNFDSIPEANNLLNHCWGYLHHLVDLPRVDLDGSHSELLPINLVKHPVYAVRANCGMGKSESLVQYLQNVPCTTKILAISFRRSLDHKMFQDLNKSELNFAYYDDRKIINIDGMIRSERLVVQIDSLHKVRGEFDILILDEFEYIGIHLVDFVKEKQFVYDALVQHIKGTKQIYIADALLSNATVDFLTQCGKPPYVYLNKFQKHCEKSVFVVPKKVQLIEMILKSVKEGQKVVVPSNCKSFVEDLATKINQDMPTIKVGLYTKETNTAGKDPAKDWGGFDIVLYSPTIVAGTSFIEKYFDVCYGYFTGQSSIAEMSFQQLFRVRALKSNNMYLCVEQNSAPVMKDSNRIDNVKHWIEERVKTNRKDLVLGNAHRDTTYGAIDNVKIDYRTGALDRNDPFFGLYAYGFKRKNESNTNYLMKLLALLQSQGIKFGGICALETNHLLEQQFKAIRIVRQDKKVNDIISAPNLPYDKYMSLCYNPNRTAEEQSAIEKYRFQKEYHLPPETVIDIETYKTYQPLMKQHHTLELLLPAKDIVVDDNIEHNLNAFQAEKVLQIAHTENIDLKYQKLLDRITDTGPEVMEVQRKLILHEKAQEILALEKCNTTINILTKFDKHNNKAQKVNYAYQLLRYLGFHHPFHPPETKVYDVVKRLEETEKYIQINKGELKAIFGLTEAKGTLHWINSRLQSELGIKVEKNGKNKTSPFVIDTLDLWTIVDYQGTKMLLPKGVVVNGIIR